MKSLISVIVPVYKVEQLLKRCINSIRNQTYRDLEIILVDDGSPDFCPEICENFAKIDSRIQVIHKKNGGLSDARNVGIEKAKGEYLCFVDSDDYIYSTMIEDMVLEAQKSDVKLVIANIKTIDEKGCQVYESEQSPIQNGIFTAEELLPKLYRELGWYYIVAWNKLYHYSLFEKIRFPVGKVHEDEYIVAQIMWKARRIACIASEKYIYIYQRKGSIMSTRQVQSQYDWLEALYLRFKFCTNIMLLTDFQKETRAVYFRELNNLFLNREFRNSLTKKQRQIVLNQYYQMEGKTKTERIIWILFLISPRFEYWLVQHIRSKRQKGID